MRTAAGFRERYGPWAVVAGGAQGLGAAFVRELAARGTNVLVVDADGDGANALARALSVLHDVRLEALALDLTDPDAATRITDAIGGETVGLLVYNAAHAHIGPWLTHDIEDQLRIVDVNVRGLLRVVHALAARMVDRGRGGVLLVGSNAGLNGHALTATYGATKAFIAVLAEALWVELRPRGIDVLAACPGATRTPGYLASGSRLPAAMSMSPDEVARESLDALGARGPVWVVGRSNRWTTRVLRLLPRSVGARAMGAMMRMVYSRKT